MELLIQIDAKRAAWREVEDELVVLDLVTSSYLSVNEAGAVLWPLLEQGATLDALVTAVLDEFEVDEATARADTESFVGELRSRDLLLGANE